MMNPPFERYQDVAHVKHAYSFLSPGGKLVALTGMGGSAKKLEPWLDEVGGWTELIDPGAFNTKDAFRRTGVSCQMVVVEK